MTKTVDLSGQKFGMLQVIGDSGTRTNAGKAQFLCKCDCGKEKIITGGNLRSGATKSCGCDKDKKTGDRSRTHGFTSHPMFRRYRSMIDRCYDQGHHEYKNYGGRGIKVCDRWMESPHAYVDDVGAPPSSTHTLDRIDNDGDYGPGNFRWATKKEQSINRRVTRMYTHNGVTMCAADWGRKLGMTKKAVLDRIRAGRSIEEAVTAPATEKGKHKRGEPWQEFGGIRKK